MTTAEVNEYEVNVLGLPNVTYNTTHPAPLYKKNILVSYYRRPSYFNTMIVQRFECNCKKIRECARVREK